MWRGALGLLLGWIPRRGGGAGELPDVHSDGLVVELSIVRHAIGRARRVREAVGPHVRIGVRCWLGTPHAAVQHLALGWRCRQISEELVVGVSWRACTDRRRRPAAILRGRSTPIRVGPPWLVYLGRCIHPPVTHGTGHGPRLELGFCGRGGGGARRVHEADVLEEVPEALHGSQRRCRYEKT